MVILGGTFADLDDRGPRFRALEDYLVIAIGGIRLFEGEFAHDVN